MQYAALRNNGVSPTQPTAPVYNTLAGIAGWFNALLPLADDLTVYIEGGQIFSQVGVTFGSFGMATNGYSLTIQTDPAELSTPAKLGNTGAMRFEDVGMADFITIAIKKLKINQDNGDQLINFGRRCNFSIEDCILTGNRPFGDPTTNIFNIPANVTGYLKNCHLFYAHAAADVSTPVNVRIHSAGSGITLNITNCIIGLWKAANSGQISVYSNGTHKNNIVYNYGDNVGYPIVLQGGSWTGTISSNPNLVNQAITSASDLGSNIMARDLQQTPTSPSIDAADPLTATLSDILGVPRN